MNFYKILTDSTKLFFINVFIYAVFLEIYILGFILQNRLHLELSFVTLFISGTFTFIAVTVWINIAHIWYRRIKTEQTMLIRALWSEAPFVLILVIMSIAGNAIPLSHVARGSMRDLVTLFSMYMVAFPLIMVMVKSHQEKIESME